MAVDRKNQAAIALKYLTGQGAPKVVAKGRGLLAEAIIERAKASGLFVHESPALVSLLMQVDLDQHIPPELYRAVAEILAFVYWLEKGEGQMAPPIFTGLSEEDNPENSDK